MTVYYIFWCLGSSLEIHHSYFAHCLAPVLCQDLPGSWTVASLWQPTVVIGKSIPQHKKEEQLRISKQGAGKRLSYHIIADTYFWIFFHMVFAFILIPSAWDKSDNWIHFLATPGFSLVPSLPSEDTFIFHSLIQLVWICKHMFAGRNLDDCNLKLKRTKTAVT